MRDLSFSCVGIRIRTRSLLAAVVAVAGLCGLSTHSSLAQSAPRPDGWVVLPVEQYRALKRAASPDEPKPEAPPVEATLSRIDYDLKVGGDLASGEARLTIDVIKEGWACVSIPAGLMVRDARLDGRPVSLVTQHGGKGTGGPFLILSRTGRIVVSLAVDAHVSSVAATEMLALPLGDSATSRAVIVLPRQGLDVRVTGGLLIEKSETSGESRWVAGGTGKQPLTFSWRRKVDDQRSTLPVRLRGSITQLVGLGEDSTQINTEVQVDVLQGLAREVRLRIPEQLTVNQVSGAMVADWSVSSNELTVFFLEPIESSTRLTVAAEAKLAKDGQIAVPMLRLSAAERETGGLAVEVLGAGEIKERDARGLDEADASELGQLIASRQSPSLVAFRLLPADSRSQRSLSIRVARYAPQAVLTANIEEARYKALVAGDGKMLVTARFAVRNNQRSFLKLSLPANAIVWTASVSGKPVRPGRAPDGSLLIPLEKGKTSEEAPPFPVEVAYLEPVPAWSEKGRARLAFVAVDLPISKSSAQVHYSPLFRVTPIPGTFRVQAYEPPASVALVSAVPAARTSTGPLDRPLAPRGLDVDESVQALVSQLNERADASKVSRKLPLQVTVPSFGPSVFLVSELTSESQQPILELDFQREKK